MLIRKKPTTSHISVPKIIPATELSACCLLCLMEERTIKKKSGPGIITAKVQMVRMLKISLWYCEIKSNKLKP